MDYLGEDRGRAEERLAPDLLDYLRRHHIGVLGHAFDVPGTTIADWAWTPTSCTSTAGGSGRVLQSFFTRLVGLDTVPPAVPVNLQAPDVGSEHVGPTWDADPDVASYVVLRDGSRLGEPTEPSWTDTTAQPGETYAYAVRAVDAAGNVSGNAVLPVTTPGPPDTTPPSAPGSLTARVVSPTRVALRWTAATDDVGVARYQVLRHGAVLTTTSGRTATDSTVTAGPHEYRVVAFDAAGNPSSAATDSVDVPAAAPRGLTGTYFDTATLTTQKTVRTDPTANFGWRDCSPTPSSSPTGPSSSSAAVCRRTTPGRSSPRNCSTPRRRPGRRWRRTRRGGCTTRRHCSCPTAGSSAPARTTGRWPISRRSGPRRTCSRAPAPRSPVRPRRSATASSSRSAPTRPPTSGPSRSSSPDRSPTRSTPTTGRCPWPSPPTPGR